MAEILGITAPGKYAVRLWILGKAALTLHPKSIIQGNGSTYSIDHHDLFPTEFTKKYILTPDRPTHDDVTNRKTVACFTVNSPTPPHMSPLIKRSTRWEEITQNLPICLDEYDIFTDGSWKRESTLSDYLLSIHNPLQVQASASLVLLPKQLNWKRLPTYCIKIIEGEALEPSSVYPLELLAIAAAHELASARNTQVVIHSDSKGAVKKVNNLHHKIRTMGNSNEVGLYEAINNMRKKATFPIEVKWVPAHTGKTTDSQLWSRNVWGNHVADRIAQGDHTLPANIICRECTAIDVTASLEKHIDWYVTDKVTKTIVTTSHDDRRHHKLNNIYLARRDASRAERGLAAKWTGCSTKFAAKHNFKEKGIMNHVTAQRTIFDKYWHGGNIAKSIPYGTDNDARHTQIKCPLCDDEDNQAHQFKHCCGINGKLSEVRDKCMRHLNQCIHKMREKYDRTTMHLIDTIREMLHAEHNGHDILLGRWTEELVTRLQARLGEGIDLSRYTCSSTMRAAIGELMVVFSLTWRTIWNERGFQVHCAKKEYDNLQFELAYERKESREMLKKEEAEAKAKVKELAKVEALAARKRTELGVLDIACYMRRTNTPYRMKNAYKRTNIVIEKNDSITPQDPKRHIKTYFNNVVLSNKNSCLNDVHDNHSHNHTICIHDTNSLVRGTIA